MEVPSPRLVPKPPPASPGDENSLPGLPGTETESDNNPSEGDSHDEELSPERQQKRDDVVGLGFNSNNNNNNKVAGTTSSSVDNIVVDNTNIGGGQAWSNNPVSSSGDGGGADLMQMQYTADRRIYNPGRPKNLETCEEEYLLERQAAPKKKYDTKGGSRSPI